MHVFIFNIMMMKAGSWSVDCVVFRDSFSNPCKKLCYGAIAI